MISVLCAHNDNLLAVVYTMTTPSGTEKICTPTWWTLFKSEQVESFV